MNHERNQGHHLTIEQLLDYLERRLEPAESSMVENHLATNCQSCQADMIWLKDTLNLMVSNIWLDPPARLRTSARRLFQDQQQRKPAFALGEWWNSLWAQPRSLAVGAAAMLIIVIIGGILIWDGPTDSSSAEIAQAQGTVEVQPAGSESWVPASGEVSLQDGSTVRTGDDSRVVLSFPDDSKVLLAPDTELSILRMNALPNGSTRVIVLRQTSGSTHNIVQNTSSPASRYEVQTPSATIIVKGTEFTVDVDEVGATRVLVNKGTVSVAAQGVTIDLDAGQATTVNFGEPPAVVEGVPTIPVPPELSNSEENESSSRETLSTVEPPSTATPTPTGTSTIEPTPTGTSTIEPTPTGTSTIEPAPASATPPPATSGPSQPPQATNTPTDPEPLPTETEMPSPTPPPSETPKKTKKPPDPPGLTNTPQPPGQTRNASTSDSSRSSKSNK